MTAEQPSSDEGGEGLSEAVFDAMEALGIEDATMTDARFIADNVKHFRAESALDAARREAEVGARALREAADALEDHTDCDCEEGDHLKRLATPRWLRARAEALAPDADGSE